MIRDLKSWVACYLGLILWPEILQFVVFDNTIHQALFVDMLHKFEMTLFVALTFKHLHHSLHLLILLSLLFEQKALHLSLVFLISRVIAL